MIAWQEGNTLVCAIRGEGVGEADICRNVEQNESQIQVWSVAGSGKQQCRVLRGKAESVFRAREVWRIVHQHRWDKETVNSVIGVPWRLADGKWTVDRPATHIDPLPPPTVLFEGARVRITRTDIEAFSITAACLGCCAIRSGKASTSSLGPLSCQG